MNFKVCTSADIPLIVQLANKIWRKYYPTIISIEQIEYMLITMYAAESIRKQMDSGHKFILVEVDAVPVAYASVSGGGGAYFLHKIYVDTENHGNGIGQILFNYSVADFEKPFSIELTVNRKNIKAINFYFKLGFVIKHIADFDIGNGFIMNDFVMIAHF